MNTLTPKYSQFFVLIVFALSVLALASCSKKASVAIIGKWQVQGEKDRIEFRKDGTVLNSYDITAGPPGDTRTFTEEKVMGKYTFMDSNHMNLQMNTGNTNNPPISIICVVHIHGDKMDMTMAVPQQHKVNFKRLE